MIALPFTPAAGRVDRVGDSAPVRRYQEYRRTLRVASMSVSAEALRAPLVAGWARRSGVGVHVHSASGLDVALTTGIIPLRITLHCNDDAELTRWGVRAAVGRFVVASTVQSDALGSLSNHSQRVLIDVAECRDPHVGLRVAASSRLELIGAHHRLAPAEPAESRIAATIGGLSGLRRRHGTIATRLSFAGLVPDHVAPRTLRDATLHLESWVEDACARFRYPRPALVLEC